MEKRECNNCGEMIPVTRDIRGQIVPEKCPYCPDLMNEIETKELIEAYGWSEIPHNKMRSFIKDDMRMNIYHTGTITIQWQDRRKMVSEKYVTDYNKLEDLLIKYK